MIVNCVLFFWMIQLYYYINSVTYVWCCTDDSNVKAETAVAFAPGLEQRYTTFSFFDFKKYKNVSQLSFLSIDSCPTEML